MRIFLDREKQPFLLQVAEDPVGGGRIERRSAFKRAKAGQEDAGLVERGNRTSPSSLPSSKSSLPQPGAMWTMPVPSVSPTASQAMTRWISRAGCAGPHFCFTATSAISAG